MSSERSSSPLQASPVPLDESGATGVPAPCERCGYDLRGLTAAHRCPECGGAFDPEYASTWSWLLPWEQRRIGGFTKRFARTILRAWLQPRVYLVRAHRRSHRMVAKAWGFGGACVLLALAIHGAEFLLSNAVFFCKLVWRHGNPSRAVSSAGHAARLTAPIDVGMSLSDVLGTALAVLLVGLLLRAFFHKRRGALRTVDLAALLAPAIPVVALAFCVVKGVLSVSPEEGIPLVLVVVTARLIYLALAAGCCARWVLSARIGPALMSAVLCGVAAYASYAGVDSLVMGLFFRLLT